MLESLEVKMKGMKCQCGTIARYETHLKFNSFDIDGWVCKRCGETYYNPEKAEKILLLNKLKKIKYHLKLSQVKSNLIMRIPKELGEALNLRKGEEIELKLQNTNEIIIQPCMS